MTAVITGDISNSRQGEPAEWLTLLKQVLNQYGQEPKQWEIFRGDSFQIELSPELALSAAIHIKATIKQIATLDVRMAIGIGEKTHRAKKVTESNGPAFVRSGECFEALKKQNLAIKSSNPETDQLINLLLALALLTMNHWSAVVSSVVKTVLENPEKNQEELAALLDRSQSTISEALKRAGFDEIMRMEQKYRDLMKSL